MTEDQTHIHNLHQLISQIGNDLRDLAIKVNQIEEKQLRDQKDVWFMIQEILKNTEEKEVEIK